MQTSAQVQHAFDMLIDPQAILNAVEASDRLRCLQRKVWRPLDRPLIAKTPLAEDTAAFDAAVDNAAESLENDPC